MQGSSLAATRKKIFAFIQYHRGVQLHIIL